MKKLINLISILLMLVGIFQIAMTSTNPAAPVLTFDQYQAVGQMISEAELAVQENMGGRHLILVSTLSSWGFFFTGASWQVVKFAQKLMENGWIEGSQPKNNAGDW